MDDIIVNDDTIPAKELQKIKRKQAYESHKKLMYEKKQADKALVLEKKLIEKEEKDKKLWSALINAKEIDVESEECSEVDRESTKEPGI